jgi:hypothetical protein
MREKLTEREKKQGDRIIDAWRAVKTINGRADKRLSQAGPLSETLIFTRRWIQPVVMDLSFCITLTENQKTEQTERELKEEVKRVFGRSADDQLDFRCYTITGDAISISMPYAVEHPHIWTWKEKERSICGQIASLRSLDVLLDDVVRAVRTELEFLRHDRPEACRDVRLMSDDERRERVEKIKSLTAEYWYEGDHKPGRYPQMSIQREAWRRRDAQETGAEDKHDKIVGAWGKYTRQVRQGLARRAEVEGDAIAWAERVAPDFMETITKDIERWDREFKREEVN